MKLIKCDICKEVTDKMNSMELKSFRFFSTENLNVDLCDKCYDKTLEEFKKIIGTSD